MPYHRHDTDDRRPGVPLEELNGPTAAELAALQTEEPLIAAELALTLAEIHVLTAEPHPTALDWRRLRRAERRVGDEARALAARVSTPAHPMTGAA